MISPWAYGALHAAPAHYQDAPRDYPAETGRLGSALYESGDPRAAVKLTGQDITQKSKQILKRLTWAPPG